MEENARKPKKLTGIAGLIVLGLAPIIINCGAHEMHRHFSSVADLQNQMLEIKSSSQNFNAPYLENIDSDKDGRYDDLRFSFKAGPNAETRTYIFENRIPENKDKKNK